MKLKPFQLRLLIWNQQLKCLKYKVSSDVNAAIPNKVKSDLGRVYVHVFHIRAEVMLSEFRGKPGRYCI